MKKKINEEKEENMRKYPEIYEKLIPVTLALIVLVIIVLTVITFGVALGVWANLG